MNNPLIKLFIQNGNAMLVALEAQAHIEALISALANLEPRFQPLFEHFLEIERNKRKAEIERIRKVLAQYPEQTSDPLDLGLVN